MMARLDQLACTLGRSHCVTWITSCLPKHLKENVSNSHAENLILYGDSCDGQNRNIGMAYALLKVVASSDFMFGHKIMVSGHSLLPNDGDFCSVKTAQRNTRTYLCSQAFGIAHS